MAHARKNQLSSSPEWWKHLQKINKRRFWKSERQAEREFIEEEVCDSELSGQEGYKHVRERHSKSLDKLSK